MTDVDLDTQALQGPDGGPVDYDGDHEDGLSTRHSKPGRMV